MKLARMYGKYNFNMWEVALIYIGKGHIYIWKTVLNGKTSILYLEL